MRCKLLLVGIVALHYVVFLAFLLTCILSLFVLQWYVALTLNALIFRVIFSPAPCPLTTLENHVKGKLGMPHSTGFLKDWILSPYKTWTAKLKKRK